MEKEFPELRTLELPEVQLAEDALEVAEEVFITGPGSEALIP